MYTYVVITCATIAVVSYTVRQSGVCVLCYFIATEYGSGNP